MSWRLPSPPHPPPQPLILFAHFLPLSFLDSSFPTWPLEPPRPRSPTVAPHPPAPLPAFWMRGGEEGSVCPAPPHPPCAAARSTGLPGGRGKRSRLQPEPAAATWVGRGGTGAEKAGPGEGGGAGSWELGSGGAGGTLENRRTH